MSNKNLIGSPWQWEAAKFFFDLLRTAIFIAIVGAIIYALGS